MEQNLNKNIIIGLERISEAFKALLREKAKAHGISPIQIQILLFVANHKENLCNVSHLAKEFNITKPTVSDAVKILHKKELVKKDFSPTDSRSYTLVISSKGKKLIDELDDYTSPFEDVLSTINDDQLAPLYSSITQLIYQLNQKDILTVQRNCHSCRFYETDGSSHYCSFLKKELKTETIRVDCPEHESK